MQVKEFVVWSQEGEALRADIRYVETGSKKPVILFLHGLNGFKNWGSFPYVLEQFARNGIITIAFNFSGSGVGEDLLTFTNLDKYTYNTVTREIEEATDMIGSILTLDGIPIPLEEIDLSRFGVFGHSLGAGISTIISARINAVRALAVWAPVSTFDRFSERQKSEWKERGYFERENSRTGQMMRLSVELLLDIEHHTAKQSILTAAKEFNRPLLIVAGAEDITAPIKEAQAIHKAAHDSVLHIIHNTGHTFGAEHPFKGTTTALDEAINLTLTFFKGNL